MKCHLLLTGEVVELTPEIKRPGIWSCSIYTFDNEKSYVWLNNPLLNNITTKKTACGLSSEEQGLSGDDAVLSALSKAGFNNQTALKFMI
ncbi:hypothetical protein TorRG33x02_101720 [Trema orientale]|uniref:Uncharacterized protein n=1 Tax=Trema orientale TaxID=63057 RepID=A0A2P5F8K8_TREOI|nr:hypothetical protein TorRG33x02_101720 [Trema orientale]